MYNEFVLLYFSLILMLFILHLLRGLFNGCLYNNKHLKFKTC